MELKVNTHLFDIDAVYKSGQTFSIIKEDNKYTVLSCDKVCVIIRYSEISTIYMRSEDKEYWKSYFNISIPFVPYLQDIKKYGNDFVKKCAEYSEGLVILKQDLWETMLSFIISQRKSIPAISTSLNRLREDFGTLYEVELKGIGTVSFKSLPRPEVLLWCNDLEDTLEDLWRGESDNAQKLLSCGLGYRDDYILRAAASFNEVETKLSSPEYWSYESHKYVLTQLRGIGDKVANCICLFAFNDLNSFPIDIWIQRVIDKGLISESDIAKFEGYKGFLQQVIFYYIINHKNEIGG